MPFQYIYPDYKDLATGKTLVVTPGSAYTIALTQGRVTTTPAFPNDGRWTSVAAFAATESMPAELSGSPASGTIKAVEPVTTADSDKSKEGA